MVGMEEGQRIEVQIEQYKPDYVTDMLKGVTDFLSNYLK